MGSIKCPLCHFKIVKSDMILENGAFHICDQCGVEFCFPMKAGSADYYEFGYGATGEGYGKEDKWEFQKFASDVKKFHLHGNLIDVGCGPGEFLKIAAKEGFNVFGIDFNKLTVEQAVSLGFKNVKVGAVTDLPNLFPGIYFDVLTMFHVLEHLEDPVGLVTQIKSILGDNSVLAIAVPNARRFFLKINPRKKRESWDYPPHHLTRWNKDSLSKFLTDHGFKILEITEERIKTPKQNYDFLRGFLSFFTSTGKIAQVKSMQFHGSEQKQNMTRKLKILKLAAFIKMFILQVPIVILTPIFYVLSQFLFLRGVNLYVLAQKQNNG